MGFSTGFVRYNGYIQCITRGRQKRDRDRGRDSSRGPTCHLCGRFSLVGSRYSRPDLSPDRQREERKERMMKMIECNFMNTGGL